MKPARGLITLLFWGSLAVSGFAQTLGKPIDDGTAGYARELVRFHAASTENLLKKNDFEPFAIGLFGWRALAIARLPFNKLEGTHLNICRLALGIYDKEIDATLTALSSRPTEMVSFVQSTPAELAVIQKFVVQKYGGKYLLTALTATGEGRTAPPKKDASAAWKYQLGASLGELAGSVTKWYAFPNNPKYDESISDLLRTLTKEVGQAPKDAPPDLLTSLKQLAAFGSKRFYSVDERQQIGAAIKQTLMTTFAFAKPLPEALQEIAKVVDRNRPAPAASTDTAKAKEVANQYRQEGLKKYEAKLYDAAIEDFNRSAELDPNNSFVYFNRGMAYLQKALYDTAIADLTKAISFGGVTADDYYTLDYRALAYIRKGDLNAALTDLNQSLTLTPQQDYGYYLRGVIYKNRGNTAQAKTDFQMALRLNPNSKLAQDELAKLGQ
jgi:tetratricopeptide (TPR) repeat protein